MNLGKWAGLVVLVVSLYVLWEIRQVLLLVFMAVVFATALNSLVRRMTRAGMKRGMAVALSIAVFLILAIGFVAIIVPPFIEQFQELIRLVPRGLERLQIWLQSMQNQMPGYARYVPGPDDLVRQFQPVATRVLGNFFALFSNAVTVAGSLLLVLVLTIMLLIDPQPYLRGFVALFPAFYRRRIREILCQSEIALVSWVGGILINMVVIGVVSGIALWLLGIPLVLANALLAGLLEAVPNVGPVLSVLAPMAVALLDTPWKAGAVLIVYIVIQQLEQYLLVPFVMARQVDILPAVTLMAQVVFAIFFGFLGLFLAIPLVIVAQIWLREIVVHDVLDQWHNPHFEDAPPQTESVIVLTPSPESVDPGN